MIDIYSILAKNPGLLPTTSPGIPMEGPVICIAFPLAPAFDRVTNVSLAVCDSIPTDKRTCISFQIVPLHSECPIHAAVLTRTTASVQGITLKWTEMN